MKKSAIVDLAILGAAAIAITGCDNKAQVQTCVDQNNVVQDDRNCEQSDQLKAQYAQIPPRPVPYWWYYHWVYGGTSRDDHGGGYVPYGHSAIIDGGRMSPEPDVPAMRASQAISSGETISDGHAAFGGFGAAGEAVGEAGVLGVASKRLTCPPREGWQHTIQNQGLAFSTLADGSSYWDEGNYYEFTAAEIDRLEAATNRLQEMCLAAGQHIIGHNLFERLGISAISAKLIRESWESEPPSIYGRFDLAFDGSQVKILEYNADTPTCLLEASVVQWNWLRDNFPHADQFNSIHDRLIAKWKELLQYCGSRLYFACLRGPTTEDVMTVTYLADTAVQAGHEVRLLEMKQIGHDGRRFVTPDNQPIRSIFKLYPWEWMVGEEFGSRLEQARLSTDWIEPIWKMMFSNKGILPILWNMFQYDDLLLPAFFEDDYRKESLTEYCRKPLLGREGKNVSLHTATGDSGRDGENDGRGYIYQAIAAIPEFNGRFPVIGSWVIDGESAGIGIRESASQITDNTSRFVPHLFIPNVEPSA